MGTHSQNLSLGPYRALDLTEGGYNWCGKVLADLGTDVIKIESPDGSPTRYHWPMYNARDGRGWSWFWEAYCVNKRSITLNLGTTQGQSVLDTLLPNFDFLLHSCRPNYLESLGLTYERLSAINPSLIVAAMTPFGLTGPYSDFKSTDIVAWSMGGMSYVTGSRERPPVRISFPQAELHAGAQAAVGAMCAFWNRQKNGQGQLVDVSTQVAVVWTLMNATQFPQLHGFNVERNGPYNKAIDLDVLAIFPCKDGYVSFTLRGGPGMMALVGWMDDENLAPEFMKTKDWQNWDLDQLYFQGEKGKKDLDNVVNSIYRFFSTKTRQELFDHAINDKFLLAPCNTLEDVLSDVQLKARRFWIDIETSQLKQSIKFPGPYVNLPESPLSIRRQAPRLGEHNIQIYIDELGMSQDEYSSCKAVGVI